MRRKILFVVLALLLVGLLGAFVLKRHREESGGEDTAKSLPAASVVAVTRGDLSSDLRVAGQFIPYQEVDLHAKVSGYIRKINVDIGDRVHTGQVIATLEVPELEAQVVGAKAEVRHSQSEIARGKSEVARAESNHTAVHAAYTRLAQAAAQRPGLIAQQELDDARAKDQDAEAQIDVAKAALEANNEQLGVSEANDERVQTMSDYSVVIAPFNGVITKRYADTGSLIQAGTASNTQSMPLVQVAQSDLLRLRMPVPETDVRYIKPGDTVQVRVQALAREFPAKIVRFTRDLDASTRTMLAEVDVPNANLTLSPGMYAETAIVLQQRKGVLIVPAQAIVKSGDRPYALFVNADKKVERKDLQLGIEGQNKQEIEGDVEPGDLVIVSGQTNYQTGEVVRPQVASDSAAPEESNQ